ncbi:MAG: hypothetical protein ACXAC7_20820 [Candidatus Hodarchaeales archaeon]|jgi:hypothetical protein
MTKVPTNARQPFPPKASSSKIIPEDHEEPHIIDRSIMNIEDLLVFIADELDPNYDGRLEDWWLFKDDKEGDFFELYSSSNKGKWIFDIVFVTYKHKTRAMIISISSLGSTSLNCILYIYFMNKIEEKACKNFSNELETILKEQFSSVIVINYFTEVAFEMETKGRNLHDAILISSNKLFASLNKTRSVLDKTS